MIETLENLLEGEDDETKEVFKHISCFIWNYIWMEIFRNDDLYDLLISEAYRIKDYKWHAIYVEDQLWIRNEKLVVSGSDFNNTDIEEISNFNQYLNSMNNILKTELMNENSKLNALI